MDDLSLALTLADAADAISLPRFGATDLTVTAKPDLTPVSDADLAVESALRALLAEQRPGDTVVGEEFGIGEDGALGEDDSPIAQAARGRAWIIDPIDGTKNFVRGVPIWATLIALLSNGIPVLGVVSAPALARRWWGSPERGSWTSFGGGEATACHVSQVARVEDASLSLASVHSWESAGRGSQMHDLSRRCWRERGYGDFFSHMLVAQGSVDISAEPELSLWDLAALDPIVRGAGGQFTTVDGAAIDARAASAIATNGLLHDAVVTALTRD